MTFKEDWLKATKSERKRYCAILFAEVLCGLGGIYTVIQFSITKEYIWGALTILAVIGVVLAMKMKWKEVR